MSTQRKTVRCAIYTRKSSEEGLEQGFNSLDAQREACAAYILSQAGEGWHEVPARYDDGGLSGGTLERPALQRLLADIAAGQIDIIVVYKVDRLTRSLLDFAKLVERFDQASVSFVSVTQSFNTTTSMGRLTLNMLLSFAQFEREVTAERIRDKIAASKARGMWMGGTPPLGYRPDGRSLAIAPDEAELVRTVFARHLALGSVRLLADELVAAGTRVPVRSRARSGQTYGGGWFARGQLYAILRNPVYIGRIAHRGTTFPGQHAALIDEPSWTAAQEQLAANRNGQRVARVARARLLQGLVTDETGDMLVVSHATKGKVRYHYYSRRPREAGAPMGAPSPALRLPAREIENAVSEAMAALLADPLELVTKAGLVLAGNILPQLEHHGVVLVAKLRERDHATIRALLTGVRVLPDKFDLVLSRAALAEALRLHAPEGGEPVFTHSVALRLTRTGRTMRLVHDNGQAVTPAPPADTQALVRLLARARQWWKLLRDTGCEIKVLAASEGVTASYMTRVVRLAFLSPRAVEAALAGALRTGIDVGALLAPGAISSEWAEQERRFLPMQVGCPFR
jgi:DNA invertase Pin-like site-specific DNA recombinase